MMVMINTGSGSTLIPNFSKVISLINDYVVYVSNRILNLDFDFRCIFSIFHACSPIGIAGEFFLTNIPVYIIS